MSRLRFGALCVLPLLASCISQSEPLDVHYYGAPLPALAGEAIPGTKPLRFDRLRAPAFLTSEMVWRVSETELAGDEGSLWAPHPADVLEERLRDLLFSRLGYRESLSVADPLLSVRVLAMEGELDGGGRARVELVADFWTADGVQHRERFSAVEELERRDSDALARGMGLAITRVSDQLAQWLVSR
jgi:ABC-type uncharacterized transport system auxiliary subunit